MAIVEALEQSKIQDVFRWQSLKTTTLDGCLDGGHEGNEKLQVDPNLLVPGCHYQISRTQGQKQVSKEEAMLKDSQFSQDVLNLKACRATKVESQFKVQEQRLG